ncbi:MAG: zinc-dependent alcohol dehydrogenase family protein [Bacteroidetes bacterium]|nr:zinc-dependent alcohol dehydrogenase family protein [Bacteroidota bacterium]
MRAALYTGPKRLDVVSRDLRPLRDDEVLVDVEACGICGTDVHIVEGTSRSSPPVVLGHEYAGRIVDTGKGVTSHALGERVAVDPNIACGECAYCRRGLVHLCSSLRALGVDIDGGMAEFCIVPAAQLYALGEDMAPEVCAFVEPVSCAVHGIDKAHIAPGDAVIIIGGGPIGQIMLQLARVAGAAFTVLVEPVAEKRALAAASVASRVVDPHDTDVGDAVFEDLPEGADVVIECAGLPSTAQLALKLARRGGPVEFFGVCPIGSTLPLEPHQVYFKELTIVGSYINPHTFSRAIALLQQGRVVVKDFPIARFPVDGVHEALRYHRENRTLKSIIVP